MGLLLILFHHLLRFEAGRVSLLLLFLEHLLVLLKYIHVAHVPQELAN